MPTATRTPRRKAGRPKTKGVLDTYKPYVLYLPPELAEALDRQVVRESVRAGRPLTRTEVMRQAIAAYVQESEAAEAPQAPPATEE